MTYFRYIGTLLIAGTVVSFLIVGALGQIFPSSEDKMRVAVELCQKRWKGFEIDVVQQYQSHKCLVKIGEDKFVPEANIKFNIDKNSL